MGDQILGAVEIKPADLADARRDQQIRRIAGQPRAGDAVLHDVERVDHDRGNAGPAGTAEKFPLHGALGREQFSQARASAPPVRPRQGAPSGNHRRAMGVDGGAMGEDIARHIGRDDDFGAEGARRRYRHRVDQRAVDQPAVADQDRREDAGQRVGGAHRIDHAAMGQPDLMSGTDFGRNRCVFHRQILDQGRPDRGLELGGEPGCRRSGRSRRGGCRDS